MKKCPNCNVDVEDHFELCWNCQYSFDDKKVLKEGDFGLICPGCKSVIDPNLHFCPYCKQDLRSVSDLHENRSPNPVQQIDCLRCKVAMSYSGNFKFHEGTPVGVFGNLFELLTNRESFELYFCPKCGKVEFFLPEVR